MVEVEVANPRDLGKLSIEDIKSRLAVCPALPSLRSVNKALEEVLGTEQINSTQISELIRRDPDLSARLLRLVNSVYYGLSTPIKNIEHAVFYLGMTQVRQLITLTPIIEDSEPLSRPCAFPWRKFWQHSVATAILAREILGQAHSSSADDSTYIAGLVHDIGKLAMAWCFPDHFHEIHRHARAATHELRAIENQLVGMDHAELGALYLEAQQLPKNVVAAVRFHHTPESAGQQTRLAAAVQLADLLVRRAAIGSSGNYLPIDAHQCLACAGAGILFPDDGRAEHFIFHGSLRQALQRLAATAESLV